MEIINNGVTLKITSAALERFIFKSQIKDIQIVKPDIIKLDIGQGINNIFITFSEVTVPATANVQLLRDAIIAMCQSGEITSELGQIKSGINNLNATVSAINQKVLAEPLLVDESEPNTIYRGFALPGSILSDAVWAIERTTVVGDTSIKKWANGNQNFTNIWNNRLTITYA
jgi:hypothetical protein